MGRTSPLRSLFCIIAAILFVLVLFSVPSFRAGCASGYTNMQLGYTAYGNVSGTSVANYTFQVDDWRREVKIDGWGGISVTDYCVLVNTANETVYTVYFSLPPNATIISVQDIFGDISRSSLTIVKHNEYVEVQVFLRDRLETGQKVKLLVSYGLPSASYLSKTSWQDYTLSIPLDKPEDWFVKQFSLVVFLPEGAEFQRSSMSRSEIKKNGFSTTITFVEHNVTKFSEPRVTLYYRYIILWVAFRPALWVGTAAAILAALYFARRTVAPSVAAAALTPLSPEILRKFVDTYEEMRRLKAELSSLERQVHRGKLSRRRYRLRRRSLDGRLSRLQRDLEELKGKVAAAGGQYSERIRELETAEVEIETLETDIERVETRFRRREINSEVYRRLLDEYNRIKDRAENTIAEVLLRFREEIH